MISRTKLAVLTAAVLVPVLLIAASAALAQEPVYIEKSDYPDPVYAGEELFYEIHITPEHPGPHWITDTLPPEVTYITDTLAPIPIPGYTYAITEGCQLVGNELGCLLWSEFGEPRSFQIKTRVAPDAVADSITGTTVANNVAWLTYWEGIPGPPGPFAAEGTFIEDLADLAVIKMSKPDIEVEAGELFTYTIFVENLGPSYARNVSIRDEILSSGAFTLVQTLDDPNRDDACYIAPDGGIPEGPGETIECDLFDPLEPKDIYGEGRWVIQVVVTADETQDVNNVVNVFSSDPDGPDGPGMPTADPDLSNNTAEDFIYVEDVADLSVTKDLDDCWYDGDGEDGECLAGGYAEFEVEVFNNGPSTAENVVVEDLLPSGVTVVGVYGDGSCTTGIPGDPLAPLICNLGNISSYASKHFYVQVRIDPDYVDAELPFDSRELENDAWVYSDIFDDDNSDNRDHEIVDVYTLSELAITKWGFPDVAGVGDGVEYEIRIFNAGPSTADMVQFADLLPTSVDYEGYYVEQGTGTCVYHDPLSHPWWDEYRGVHCYVDEIPPGGTVMVHLLGTYNENLWWFEDWEKDVCNRIPDDDPVSGFGDYWGVDDPWDQPGWWADSYIAIPWENSQIGEDPEYLGWCPYELYVEADLSIEKTSEPMKLYPGEQKTYHVEVTNNGPTGAPGVMVSDTLPYSVTYEIDNGDCEQVGWDPDVLECDLGNMMPGETKGFDVWAVVAPDAPPGEITNEAQVSMEWGEDPNPENNTAHATNLVLEPTVANLGLQKWWGQAPSQWFDGAPFTPEDCYLYDESMNLYGVRAGCPFTYSLAISNTGPLAAENVVVEDLMPAGVTVEGVEPEQGSCTTGIPGDPDAPLTCNLGDIPRDEGTGITVFVRTDADLAWEPLENDAVVFSDVPDPDNGNNRAHVLIWVEPFSYLGVNKEGPADPPEITAGEQIEYWINLWNEGPSTAHEVYLNDELPEGVSLVDAEVMVGDGSCEPDSALCSLGDLEPGGNRGIRVRGYVEPWLEEGTVITNTAHAWAHTSPFTFTIPVTPSVETLVHSAADLSVWKEAEPWKIYAGEQVMYTIEVANNGPGNAYSVLMTDTLPSGVLAELVTDPACVITGDFTGEEVDCYWDVFPLGETKTFYIFARVEPDAEPGTVSNQVWVASETTYDPVQYNDYASAPILIQGRADLKVQKFGKPEGEVRAGDELTYTVIVDNLGTGYAHQVTLDDVLESNGSFDLLGVTSSRDALCDPETGTFDHDMFLSCALSDTLEVKGPEPGSGRWMLTVEVLANEPQDINNIAYVAGSDYDPDLSNNEAMAEHEITAVADLELTTEAWGEMPVGCFGETELWLDEVAAGNTVTYTLTVSNTGPSTAENVTVYDNALPSPDLLEIDVESIDASQGNCLTTKIVDERTLTCNLGTISPYMTATVTFVAHVPSWVPDATPLYNDAQVFSDMFDDDNGNDFSTHGLLVSRVADLEVIKTQDPEICLPTWDITYSITVTNLGPSDVEGVFISDTIPVQVLDPTWTCCASDDGECDVPCEPPVCPEEPCPWPDIGLYAQADIPAGELVIYTVEGTLDWWPCGPFTNTVTLIPPESLTHPPDPIDPCPDNNTDEAVNDPMCHYDPLILKDFPGPDSSP
jgi:uncharacterized repeat protein (TIGR01451 family)